MSNRRFKNVDWYLPVNDNNGIQTWQAVEIAVLMDIRDELQTLNRVLQCPNFLEIPQILRRIDGNTKKRKPAKRSAKAKVSR